MNKTQNIGKIFSFLIALSFVSTTVQAQTPAVGYAQSSSIATSQRVLALVADYEAASDIMKPNVARAIAREVQPLRRDPAAALVLARADIILSHQAATDGRKDLALRKSRDAAAAAARITTSEGRIVRALAASALARALLLKENYLDAIRTTTAARRAFGPVETNADPAIDELEMWDHIALISAPTPLASQAEALALPQTEVDALHENQNRGCSVGGVEIERNGQIGTEALFPVLSALEGVGGGAVTRSTIDASGKVVRVVTTAYSPTEGFAAAAERAVATWQYSVPDGISEVCRASVRTVFAFAFK
jgi:hypothetical protein